MPWRWAVGRTSSSIPRPSSEYGAARCGSAPAGARARSTALRRSARQYDEEPMELQLADRRVVQPLAPGLVVADVVSRPPFAERLAARRQLADEVAQRAVVRVAARFGAQRGDGVLRGLLPVGEELLRAAATPLNPAPVRSGGRCEAAERVKRGGSADVGRGSNRRCRVDRFTSPQRGPRLVRSPSRSPVSAPPKRLACRCTAFSPVGTIVRLDARPAADSSS